MSETPETDAEGWKVYPYKSTAPLHFVPSDFARKLERERDGARAAYRALQESDNMLYKRMETAETERDQLRADAAVMREALQRIATQFPCDTNELPDSLARHKCAQARDVLAATGAGRELLAERGQLRAVCDRLETAMAEFQKYQLPFQQTAVDALASYRNLPHVKVKQI